MAETVSMKQIYNELKKIERTMVTKQEMDVFRETIGVLGNPKTMRQIADSMDDIAHGRFQGCR